MTSAARIAFGWLIPGGTYLLRRKYLQFAVLLLLISTAVAAGMALQGSVLFPTPAELQGADGLTTMLAWAGSVAKALAGGPYLLTLPFASLQTFLSGRTHEFGTVLLEIAGLFNLLAIADAMETETR
jgi:hypothetical protein